MATNPLNPDGTPKTMMQLAAEQIAASNTVTPVLNTFDETKGVAGRVNQITSQNSPLMQGAATRGTQVAAARGLTNSSLAAEASQKAIVDTATPIATADASLYGQAQLANQTASNNASTTNATLGVNAGLQGLSFGEQARQFGVTSGITREQMATQKEQFGQNLALQSKQVDAQIQQFAQSLGIQVQELGLRRDTLTAQQQQALDQLNLQKSNLAQQQSQFETSTTQAQKNFQATQQQQLVMQGLDQANKIALANIDATWRKEVNGSQTLQGSWNSMMNNIQAIQNNANLDGPAKATLVQNTLDAFGAYATFFSKTTGIDVGPLLDFGTVNPATGTSPGAAPNTGAGSSPGAGVSPGAGPPPIYTAPYAPPEAPPTCFPAGAMVRMADGKCVPIETVVAGDMVLGAGGPTKVLRMETPLLGARRMLGNLFDLHRWSEEHAHWTRDWDGRQWWWAANKPMWQAEVAGGAIGGLKDNESMRTGPVQSFAHISGWVPMLIVELSEYGPDTQLYLPITAGAPIIVDDYVVGAGVNEAGFDYAAFDWDEVRRTMTE